MHPALALAIAYASGSLPFAWLAGRAAGVDLRQQGSGNLGATNVFRVLGWKVGLAVFVADALKGALPVLLLPPRIESTIDPALWAIACGIAAIAGHVRPLFLRFRKGGKGVATAAGVFFALAPLPMLVTFGLFVAVVLATGYVSLGSLLSAVVLPAFLLVTQGSRAPLFVVSVIIASFVFWTHRANIGRLRRGEEHRFGKRSRS
ncbi:MAG: glycerol-3-phosphate 1-O-acyltransferase PlsY [Gemmatimonadaceae bacterium]|nr:glycerol-3-phosphate 1-O-acyltransferase PlsY [Gemmatimonadaceae bacterium]NUP56123.1 glycerol-3-phosphate 1-O-acyltransferase PlsY [Gemmatimonadaceae bacterium]NUP69767.1 glycerol-3-phosphate 1-O-acyltransferase PlsY [Gemmatimonadaceae bacterium]NUS33264.1 glycerol-3-phosphate 1-O-acyltransferase PlsY [Gemmatimonadaceae bacterium]NUS48093.1 glycerol-3-phosphate 1-O-acyltransferase PlsY [Gemmatimonadaceae bacterium]